MNILFSPIGNTDPWRDLRDGSMLHIVRHYQPKKVILFFTESIYKSADDSKKGHDQYDWKHIINSINPFTEVELIVEAIDNPHDYDVYKDTFHKILDKVHKTHKDATILLNVTSGTPQMGATLCLEYVTYPDNKKAIQVATPKKRSNAGLDHDSHIEIEESLELVNEVEKNSESRYKEIKILSFREAMLRSSINELLNNYDYVGVRELFKQLKNDKAVAELSVKIQDINRQRVFSDINKKYSNHKLKKGLCQFLVLQMRFNQKNYSDVLIRLKAITEFLAETYLVINHIIINSNSKYFEFELEKYSVNLQKNQYNEVLKTIKSYYLLFDNDSVKEKIVNEQKLSVVEYDKIKSNINHVIDINEARNSIAHSLDEIKVKESEIGYAFNAVKELLINVFPTIKQRDLFYFEQFNERIKELL